MGFVAQCVLVWTHLWSLLRLWLVQYQCDMDRVRAAAESSGVPVEKLLENYLINWPQFFRYAPEHLGWILGLAAGVCLYFACFGKFRNGASLIVYMAAGWLIAFLLMPVLFGFGGAGLRMTPPRSDDWAASRACLSARWSGSTASR